MSISAALFLAALTFVLGAGSAAILLDGGDDWSETDTGDEHRSSEARR